MDHKIVTIAGIVFSMVFIMIMASIFFVAQDYGESTHNEMLNTKQRAVAAELESYNERIVSGDTVISTINKMKETTDGLKLSYGVCVTSPSEEGNWQWYGYGGLKYSSESGASGYYTGTQSTVTSYKLYDTTIKPGTDGYVSPTKEFKAHLISNTNGIIVGIVFIGE